MAPTGTEHTPPGRRHWLLFAGLAAAVFLFDQATKFLAVKHLTFAFELANAEGFFDGLRAYFTVDHPPAKGWKNVVEAFWSHRYAENPGAAWSFAGGWPTWVRVPFFHAITIAAVGIILHFHRRTLPGQWLLRVALALLLGGALGNWADRLAHGYVIDFIDWHLDDAAWTRPQLHWPTFNVADAGITSGVSLILLDGVIAWWRERRQNAPVADRQAS